MTERYFLNNLPDYETLSNNDKEGLGIKCSTEDYGFEAKPYFTSPQEFLLSGQRLKDQIIKATWNGGKFHVKDPYMYTGLLGTAFLCFRCYEASRDLKDLISCLDMVDACADTASTMKLYYTFLCGMPGIYALGAAASKLLGDETRLEHYTNRFLMIAQDPLLAVGPAQGGFGLPYELLYGRAGFLWSALFFNHYVGPDTISSAITKRIIDAIIAGGKVGAISGGCPLMYRWHGTRYLGAAHGIFGIIHTLLHFDLNYEQAKLIKSTLHYLIKNRLPSGNYPSSEGNEKDQLVHWCHGSPGAAITLCKAAKVFPEQSEFLQAAIEAGEVVWNRGLLRRLGICHGVSGNTYVFLSLFNATKNIKFLHRARAFATFLHHDSFQLISAGEMHGGDRPYSLFEGMAGLACMWLDVARPERAKFPGYEI